MRLRFRPLLLGQSLMAPLSEVDANTQGRKEVDTCPFCLFLLAAVTTLVHFCSNRLFSTSRLCNLARLSFPNFNDQFYFPFSFFPFFFFVPVDP